MSLSFSDAAKAKKLRDYFARHGRIYIVINATLNGVDVPEQFQGDPALRLVLNSRMPQPIFIHDDILESDFSFSGHVYPCRIPMHSIWATYLPDGDLEQGIIWDDSVPEMIQSIVQAVRSNIHADTNDADITTAPADKPVLRPVADASVEKTEHAATAPEHIDSKPEKNDHKGRKVKHLRVVK